MCNVVWRKYAEDIFRMNIAGHAYEMCASTGDTRKQIHFDTNIVCKLEYIDRYFVFLTSILWEAGLERSAHVFAASTNSKFMQQNSPNKNQHFMASRIDILIIWLCAQN